MSVQLASSAFDIGTKLHVHDGNVTFERIQDCTPIHEQTQALHKEGLHGSGEMKHAARLPYVLVEKYCNDNGILFSEFMSNKVHVKRMLNDPSLAGFRVWKGQV